MLDIKQIDVTLNGYDILKKFNLQVAQGEFVAVMGNSGSGKTTLLNAIGLLVDINSGSIEYKDFDYSKLSTLKKIKYIGQEIGYIFQDYYLSEEKSIYDNLEFCCTSKSKKDKIKEISLVLEELNLHLDINKKVVLLSGGEQQRIAIARTLLRNCSLILADEPTGSVDDESAKLIMSHFINMKNSGKTIIMVTHSKEMAKYADRTVIMKDVNAVA